MRNPHASKPGKQMPANPLPARRDVDDIIYAAVDGPSPFAHPLCANTWRNGMKLGDEAYGTY